MVDTARRPITYIIPHFDHVGHINNDRHLRRFFPDKDLDKIHPVAEVLDINSVVECLPAGRQNVTIEMKCTMKTKHLLCSDEGVLEPESLSIGDRILRLIVLQENLQKKRSVATAVN